MLAYESATGASAQLLIIHELGRRWVDALRGIANGSGIQLRHSVGIHDTLSLVRVARYCTLLIELGAAPLQSLEILERISDTDKEVVVIVVARSDQQHLEELARELGAVAFLKEPLSGREMAKLVGSVLRLQRIWAEKMGIA